MGKRKLFNDPLYGLINFKYEFIYDIINHPFFQRLRRIRQMGLSEYVYPGAVHTRFQHAIGATNLMQTSIRILRDKGIEITEEEAEAMCLAILLHDIGHGPISHSLEKLLLPHDHEEISLWYMNELNTIFEGKLDLTIKIFTGKYPRKFMQQLVSGQLDMDRMDYLIRDSFFSGVAEGVIGYDRIISMLNVVDDQLVVEEKASYSIQKFLMAREIMYKQVYLHKTSLSAEIMLKLFFRYLKTKCSESSQYLEENNLMVSHSFADLLHQKTLSQKEKIDNFSNLDDSDIYILLKSAISSNDNFLSELAKRLINRNLFKIKISNTIFESDFKQHVRQKVKDYAKNYDIAVDFGMIEGAEAIKTYSTDKDEIFFLLKNGFLEKLSNYFPDYKKDNMTMCYYLCYAV